MGAEGIVLGIVSIAFGAFLMWKGVPTIPASLFIIFGIVLIVFNRDEDTIERRKDL